MSTEANPINRYRAIREKKRALHGDLLKRYLAKDALAKSARKLGIPYRQNTFVFDSTEEMTILADYCVYDYRDVPLKGKPQNAVEKRLERDPPPDGSEELEILRACASARYTILVTEEPKRGHGVNVLDLFSQERFFLTDVNLGDTAAPGMAVATRVVSPFGIHMTTGTALLLDRSTTLSALTALAPMLKTKTGEELARMTSGERSRMAATIIRIGLEAGATNRVEYV